MKIFVTGGTGFIGANLVRLLVSQGYYVKALVRSDSGTDNLKGLGVEIVRGDLIDNNLANKIKGCEVVFHVAAHYSLWQKDKDILYQSNVLGTRNILKAAREAGVERTVYTSSVAAIGVGKMGESVDEFHQTPVEKLVGYYKQSKYWGEQEAVKAVQQGQDIVIVNPSTPIGPWDIKPTPTGDIILRFLRGQMPYFLDTGLNFIDVRDVAKGHLLALTKGETGSRYILGHQNLSLKAFLDLLAGITGLNAPSKTIPLWLPMTVAWVDEMLLTKVGKSPSVPLDGVRMSQHPMYYNPTKAVTELGLPQSSIERAIEDAVTWFVDKKYVIPQAVKAARFQSKR